MLSNHQSDVTDPNLEVSVCYHIRFTHLHLQRCLFGFMLPTTVQNQPLCVKEERLTVFDMFWLFAQHTSTAPLCCQFYKWDF